MYEFTGFLIAGLVIGIVLGITVVLLSCYLPRNYGMPEFKVNIKTPSTIKPKGKEN